MENFGYIELTRLAPARMWFHRLSTHGGIEHWDPHVFMTPNLSAIDGSWFIRYREDPWNHFPISYSHRVIHLHGDTSPTIEWLKESAIWIPLLDFMATLEVIDG